MQYSRLSTQKVNRILLCFCGDITATAAAKLAKVNRKTVNNYYNAIRKKILAESLREMSMESGEFEADESYFGARRVRGRRGRGAAGKTPVFGLLKRGGKVLVKAVENCSREELMPVRLESLRRVDREHGYDHYRVFHSRNEFARGKNQVYVYFL